MLLQVPRLLAGLEQPWEWVECAWVLVPPQLLLLVLVVLRQVERPLLQVHVHSQVPRMAVQQPQEQSCVAVPDRSLWLGLLLALLSALLMQQVLVWLLVKHRQLWVRRLLLLLPQLPAPFQLVWQRLLRPVSGSMVCKWVKKRFLPALVVGRRSDADACNCMHHVLCHGCLL